jgi:hypothetical protein
MPTPTSFQCTNFVAHIEENDGFVDSEDVWHIWQEVHGTELSDGDLKTVIECLQELGLTNEYEW